MRTIIYRCLNSRLAVFCLPWLVRGHLYGRGGEDMFKALAPERIEATLAMIRCRLETVKPRAGV